jgi:hypothetical protein
MRSPWAVRELGEEANASGGETSTRNGITGQESLRAPVWSAEVAPASRTDARKALVGILGTVERCITFTVTRDSFQVSWRRVLHTCHHRTLAQARLRLAGHEPVPASYGPSGDV